MSDEAIDAAAVAALERAADQAPAQLQPRLTNVPIDHAPAPPTPEPLPPVIPSRLVPIVTLTGPQGQLQSAIDLGPLDARLARLETKLIYVMGLVMASADVLRVTDEEQEKNMASIRQADAGPARPARPGGGGR